MLDALLPLACPGCGRSGAPLCPTCVGALHAPAPAPPPAGIDAWCAAFAYEDVARELVARVKYRGARAAVPWLAAAMVAALPASWPTIDLITWAPTSRARRTARGFDPAELLARRVARQLRTRCLGLLDRRSGPPQTGLTAADRRRGPTFEVRRRAPGATVLLVDDVATTGATLAAAASALRCGGADVVLAATTARTPPPRARRA